MKLRDFSPAENETFFVDAESFKIRTRKTPAVKLMLVKDKETIFEADVVPFDSEMIVELAKFCIKAIDNKARVFVCDSELLDEYYPYLEIAEERIRELYKAIEK